MTKSFHGAFAAMAEACAKNYEPGLPRADPAYWLDEMPVAFGALRRYLTGEAPPDGAPIAPAPAPASPAILEPGGNIHESGPTAIGGPIDVLREKAQAMGYLGEACNDCLNFTMTRNGTCLKCHTCGGTSGCS